MFNKTLLLCIDSLEGGQETNQRQGNQAVLKRGDVCFILVLNVTGTGDYYLNIKKKIFEWELCWAIIYGEERGG